MLSFFLQGAALTAGPLPRKPRLPPPRRPAPELAQRTGAWRLTRQPLASCSLFTASASAFVCWQHCVLCVRPLQPAGLGTKDQEAIPLEEAGLI